MHYEPIKYLDWARENMGNVPFDLANSALRRLRAEDLELTIDQIPLSAPGDKDDAELIDLLARQYQVRPTNIALTSGATAGIFLSLSSILSPGEEVLVESPCYEPLVRVARHLGAEVKSLERTFEKRFQLDLEVLERRISRNTRAIVITNLHNPSGVATQPEKLQTVRQIAKEAGAHVICSEVYLDAAFERPLVPAATLGENMITLSSVSKVFGLGPTRMGWIVAEERVIDRVHRVENYIYCETSYPSQRIALAALKRREALRERALETLRTNFNVLKDWVHSHAEVRWVEPDGGNIALLRLLHGIDSWEFHRLAKEKHGTLVAPGDLFQAKGFIRVSFGGEPDVFYRGLENLSQALRTARKERRG